jgi:hypothetical protein
VCVFSSILEGSLLSFLNILPSFLP